MINLLYELTGELLEVRTSGGHIIIGVLKSVSDDWITVTDSKSKDRDWIIMVDKVEAVLFL